MTQHVRTSYRRHRKATWAAVLVVVVAAALALVVPALGINDTGCTPDTSTCVKPASGQGITPSVVNVGGSTFSCATHALGVPAGMQQFQISNPVPGSYTDPTTGVKFVITAPSGGKDPKDSSSPSRSWATRRSSTTSAIKGGTNSSCVRLLQATLRRTRLSRTGACSPTPIPTRRRTRKIRPHPRRARTRSSQHR